MRKARYTYAEFSIDNLKSVWLNVVTESDLALRNGCIQKSSTVLNTSTSEDYDDAAGGWTKTAFEFGPVGVGNIFSSFYEEVSIDNCRRIRKLQLREARSL
jgi:hypothetical protein